MSNTGLPNLVTTPNVPDVGHVPTASDERTREPAEQRFLMRGIDWTTYRKISDALSGRHFRLAYDRGNLELMTISSTHGNAGRLVVRLVAVLTEETGLPLKSCGDMTCDKEEFERGVEPDECFYITHESQIRHKERIDLASDPPPDLAAEIDITRSSLYRLGIYAALKVPEVWRYDGERVNIYQLSTDGRYVPSDRSQYFSFLSGMDLAQFLNQRNTLDENSLVRLFRAWVREQIDKKK